MRQLGQSSLSKSNQAKKLDSNPNKFTLGRDGVLLANAQGAHF
jgi:hypothetical protein